MRSLLTALQLLLNDPQPADAQDAVVGSMMTKQKEMYERTARYWTAVFASHDPQARKKYPDYERKLEQLKQLLNTNHIYWTEAQMIAELSANAWEVDRCAASWVR